MPGQLGVRVAEGTNDLIKDGAHLIRDARDVLDLLFGVGVAAVRRPAEAGSAPASRPAAEGRRFAPSSTWSRRARRPSIGSRSTAGWRRARWRSRSRGWSCSATSTADALGAYALTGLKSPE